jgi:hypothetical protein
MLTLILRWNCNEIYINISLSRTSNKTTSPTKRFRIHSFVHKLKSHPKEGLYIL